MLVSLKTTCFFLFFLFTDINFSLSNDVQISGRVIDKILKTPIEFANILIEGELFGVISNANGNFILNIPEKFKDRRIVVSCLGYKTDTICLKDFKNNYIIELESEPIILEEVVVKPINPVDVIRTALEKIPENYATYPVILNSYYREMIKVDTAFVKYSDAACRIFYCSYEIPYDDVKARKLFFKAEDTSFFQGSFPFPQAKFNVPHQNDAVSIIEVRKSNNLEHFNNKWDFEENMKKFDIGGGPLQVTAADLLKRNEEFLDINNLNFYSFKLKGEISYNNKSTYVILFYPKTEKKQSIWEGTLYIDKLSYAIIKIDFKISKNCVKYIKDYKLDYTLELTKGKTIKETGKQIINRETFQVGQTININYTNIDQKWYLNQVRIENSFVNVGDLFDTIKYKTYLDLFVNNIEFEDVSFAPESVYNTNNYNFLYKYPSRYNSGFWKTYNMPLPSGLFQEALKDIEKEKSLNQQFMEQP